MNALLNITQTWSEKEELFPGIWVYRNVIKPELDIINRIEDAATNNNIRVGWSEALVGKMEKHPEYRDCLDFKINKMNFPDGDPRAKHPDAIKFNKIWQDCYDAQIGAVDDYCKKYNIEMKYWEASNFVKYSSNQHFQEHADHGWSYICTVSLVAYPNDDYEGGELTFPKLGVKVKPKAGDLYIFPSTFLFSHRAEKITSGTKYSIVTMLDYNDKAHSQAFHNEKY